MNVFHQNLETLIYIRWSFPTYFHKGYSESSRQWLPFFYSYFSLIREIVFCRHEHPDDVTRSIGFYLRHPFLNVIKWLAIYYRVSQYNTSSAFVICLCNVLESLLPSRVPNLHLVLLIVDCYCLYLEINAYCSNVWVLEMVLAKSSYQIGLAHPAVTNNNYLDHEIVFLGFLCWFHSFLLT